MKLRDVLGPAAVAGVVLALPAGAAAQGGQGVTAPAYPGNTISIAPVKQIVGGTVTQVQLSGMAQWNDGPTDNLTTPYSVSLYVQDPTVDPQCGASYSTQLQKSINIRASASDSISGWVMQGNVEVRPSPPAQQQPWTYPSTPFVVKQTLKNVLLCAYVQYVTDDVAAYALPVKVVPPRCEFSHAAVRRGPSTTISCNATGALDVRFKRGRLTRTKHVTVKQVGRLTKLSLAGISKGSYSVSFSVKGQSLGSDRLRVT